MRRLETALVAADETDAALYQGQDRARYADTYPTAHDFNDPLGPGFVWTCAYYLDWTMTLPPAPGIFPAVECAASPPPVIDIAPEAEATRLDAFDAAEGLSCILRSPNPVRTARLLAYLMTCERWTSDEAELTAIWLGQAFASDDPPTRH